MSKNFEGYKYIEDEKQLEKIEKMVEDNSDIIKEIYSIFYDEEVSEVGGIGISNVNRQFDFYKKEVVFTMGIICYCDDIEVTIQDITLNYIPSTKEMYWDNSAGAFMSIEAYDPETDEYID